MSFTSDSQSAAKRVAVWMVRHPGRENRDVIIIFSLAKAAVAQPCTAPAPALTMSTGAVGEMKAAKWVGAGMVTEQRALAQTCGLWCRTKGLFSTGSEGKQEEPFQNVSRFESFSIFHSWKWVEKAVSTFLLPNCMRSYILKFLNIEWKGKKPCWSLLLPFPPSFKTALAEVAWIGVLAAASPASSWEGRCAHSQLLIAARECGLGWEKMWGMMRRWIQKLYTSLLQNIQEIFSLQDLEEQVVCGSLMKARSG